MIIGVPKETKPDEYRVALLPVGAHLLAADKHTVLVETNAGLDSGFSDEEYAAAGAQIVDNADAIYSDADMVVKVKEPQAAEMPKLRPGQILFCYFHFASSRELTADCLKSGITAVAYETLVDQRGRLPLLTPMSEIAGKMSVQEGAKYLERPTLGHGILLGGVPGVSPANVLILGGGVVGINAAHVAAGFGAHVVIMDIDINRLRHIDEIMPANVTTIYCDPHSVRSWAIQADLIVGAVLVPGGRTPVLINKPLLSKMKTGSVIVDVCVDQGGCVETCRPTSHHEPTYVVDGVVHYCVTNIPGAVPRTSSRALCNATLPYVRSLAELGVEEFAKVDAGHRTAINMANGDITCEAVAKVFPDLAG